MVHRILSAALVLACVSGCCKEMCESGCPPTTSGLVSALEVQAGDQDWPQFRGPKRDGISQETGLLKEWPKEGPKLLWTFTNAGLGFSSFAVVGDTVYINGTRNDDEVVIAIDLDKGGELWTAKIGPIFTFKTNVWGDGPRSTPTVDGNLLYALGGQGELICIDRKNKGKEVWRKNLMKDLGGEMMSEWGYSESPLVDGDTLICTPGGGEGTLAALDKKTGAVKWRSKELKYKAPYASVVAAEINGVRQYVFDSYIDDNKGGVISGVAAKDGKLLWSMPIFEGHNYAISPTPIVKDNMVYATCGYGGGCHLFAIDKNMKAKDMYPAKIQKKVKNTHGGVLLIGDYVYGHTEKETWFCQNFNTGKIAWDERTALSCPSGTITSAEGKLYLVTEEGEVALADVDPTKFTEISKFTLPKLSNFPSTRATSKYSKVWSHPVVSHGRLFLRDCEFVYCYDIRAKK